LSWRKKDTYMPKLKLKNHKQVLHLSDRTLDSMLLKWQKKISLELFHRMAKEIPAYKKFLKSNNVRPATIKKPEDLNQVPAITKANYFRKYSIQEKLWPGLLETGALVGTATSGSTGKPTYFLRSKTLDWQYSILAEHFLQNGPSGPTLLINCFGMGIWIGGLITYQAFYDAANRGQQLSIVTPGINKKEIFNCLREMAPSYKNIIFSGYPPFVKDLIDEAVGEGIDLKKWHCRFVFAAESFTENFRDYIVKQSGVKNIYSDTLNIYGTAELGAMAFETPTSILIRRLAVQNQALFGDVFKEGRLPTLCQYNPEFIAFEKTNGELAITSDSAMPTCRYQLGDNGGFYTLSELILIFKNHGIDLGREAKKHGIKLSPLPFVYVYERSDFSVTLYGLQIYPQTIKRALEENQITKHVTGKFSMETAYDNQNNQYLKVNIELKPKMKASAALKASSLKAIIKHLLKENSEYRELSSMLEAKRTRPQLVFWKYNDDSHFKNGGKQTWLKK
jgi:phenylacetate-CoA ligase